MTLATNQTYLRQPQTTAPTVMTYRDLIDRVGLTANSGPTAQQIPEYRVAIEEAYRGLAYSRTWRYLLQHFEITPSAPQITGTIQYTQSTRTVTLTGATWPSWVLYGHISFGLDPVSYVAFDIESVTDSTNIVLALNANPGQDLATGTGYTLFRSVFTLPPNFQKMYNPENRQILWSVRYCEPADWFRRERHIPIQNVPYLWTVMADPRLIGSMAVFTWPAPADQSPFGALYLAKPRDLRISGWGVADFPASGSVTVAISGTAVTGTGTSFGQQHVGSMFRVSSFATNPDGTVAYPDGRAGTNPYAEQDIIASVTDSTHCTLASGFVGTYTGMPYCISDPVDMPEWMLQALLARARLNYIANRPTTAASVQLYSELAQQAYVKACESDQLFLPGPEGPYYNNPLMRDVPASSGIPV